MKKIAVKLKNFIQNNLYIILIFILALILRTWWLNIFPVALTHDELEYVMQAKSLFYTGQGIPTTPPFGLFSLGQTYLSGNVLAELPSFLIIPFVGPFGSSQFLAKLPYAIISSLTVVIIFLIFKTITGKRSLALLASLVLALNPWGIHFGRTNFEFTFSVFFYLVGIYIVIKAWGWKILYSLPFFLAGFLSYHGAKLLFFPLILVVSSWRYLEGSKTIRKPLIILVLISILISVGYFLTLKYQPASARMGELISINDSATSNAVINERRLSIPGIQQEVFLNKATYFLQEVTNTYLHNFSTEFLFITGENRGAYSFWVQGLFYYIDFPLIIFGLIGLYMVSKRGWFLVMAIIALSPLTSIMTSGTEKSYVIRSGLMFPWLAALSGIGIWYLLNQFKKYKFVIGGVILVVYLFSVANFLNLYFTRYPIYNSEGFFLSNKILSRYIDLTSLKSEQTPIIVAVTEPRILFEKFLFYNNRYSRENASSINQKIASKDYSYKNVRFIDKCSQMQSTDNGILIYESKLGCGEKTQPVSRILSLADAGSLFIIKNDRLCGSYNLPRYPRINNIFEFDIYKLSETDFCKTWISLL